MRHCFAIALLTLLLWFPAAGQRNITETTRPPKLAIGIVIENMRPDYIQRYWNKFQPDGFKKLYTHGAVCSNFRLTQHVHNYATGTATLFTGVNPSSHGIVDVTWYDRLKEKEVNCIADEYYFTVGADTKAGNASPKKLTANTIGDNLKLYTMGKAKVYSVALNDVSSIFSAGHAADAAYWFDPGSGRMISSSFYLNTFPDWVRIFNTQNFAEIYSHRNWVTLLSEDQYTESVADDYLYEKGYGEKASTFPHVISRLVKKAGNYNPLKTTPFANTLIKDFALALFENEPVGTDDITDLVTVFFSSMDYENGSFGPVSLEMEDLYLRLDQEIAALVNFAEKKYGKENILFFLTSNMSASYPVDYLKEEFTLPVGNFSPESAIALLTSFLNITYGEQKWIEHVSGQQLYLNHKLIEKHKINLNEIRNQTSNFINQFEGVKFSLPAQQLEQGGWADNGALGGIYNTYQQNRSGDVLYILNEGWQPFYKFRKVNYTDQIHLPLVFYGHHIKPATLRLPYDAVDLAPTLSELLQIPLPDKSKGKIMEGVGH